LNISISNSPPSASPKPLSATTNDNINLDYLKAYYSIVNIARFKERSGYLELHHIVPRCIFGENLLDEKHIRNVDEELNLVYLTAREHFVCHWLLHRAFPKNKKLGLAFWAMAGMISPDHKRYYTPSSRAIAEARIAAANSRRTPVLQYDLEGNFITEYNSLNSASESVGIVPNAIGQNLSNFTKSAGGFQWRFKTKNYQQKIEPYVVENNGLPIGQYDLEGNLIYSFENLLDAERKTGHSEGSIRAAMNRGAKIKGTSYFFIQFNKHQEVPKAVEPYVIPLHGFSIPIIQISSDGKYFINKFPSISHAAKYLNKNTGHISAACKGNRQTAYGYIWKYLSDYTEELPSISIDQVKIKLHSKPIAQYNLQGKFIRSFNSASAAAREVNDTQGNISAVARGKRNYSNGFQYAYIKNGRIPTKSPINLADNFSRAVIQLDMESGKIVAEFQSVGTAAKAVSGSQSNISACINGRKKSAYGYNWKFK
jgi:NUMOD1 domain